MTSTETGQGAAELTVGPPGPARIQTFSDGMMAAGTYQDPAGAWYSSVLF
jgi:hypothetical protein